MPYNDYKTGDRRYVQSNKFNRTCFRSWTAPIPHIDQNTKVEDRSMSHLCPVCTGTHSTKNKIDIRAAQYFAIRCFSVGIGIQNQYIDFQPIK